MDGIHPHLLPLPPDGGRIAEKARSAGSSHRSPDFHEEFRREVARGHSADGNRDRIVARETRRNMEKPRQESTPSDVKERTTENNERSPSADSAQTAGPRDVETDGTDDVRLPDDAISAQTNEDDEIGLSEIAIEDNPELQVIGPLPLEEWPANLSEGNEAEIVGGTTKSNLPSDGGSQPVQVVPTPELIEGNSALENDTATPHVDSGHLRPYPDVPASGSSGDDPSSADRAKLKGHIKLQEGPLSESTNSGLQDDNASPEVFLEDVRVAPNGTLGPTSDSQAPEADLAKELSGGTTQEPATSGNRSTSVLVSQRLAPDSLGHSARPSPATPEPSQLDPSRFVSRVSRAFEAANTRGGAVLLRLSPPELGAMRVELSVQQGVLSAHMETENAAAKSLLIDNLPALRERLAALDIRVERFDVDVRQDGTDSQPDWQTQQESRDHQQGRAGNSITPEGQPANRPSASEMARPSSPWDATGRLNTLA